LRPLLVGLILVAACQAQKQGRVFLISLDGLGYQAFSEDPAAEELQSMRRLAEQGIYAPMQAAFPSLTAPGHASIFTGVYGNKNGVTSNNVPVSFGQRVNGFRAESLKAETFWVKAARSGVKSVAHNPTQGFPCNPFNSAPGVTLFNGYQTATVAPSRLLTAKDVKWLETPPPGFVSPLKSRQPIRYFRYDAGRIQFVGAIFAKGLRYDTVRMTAFSGKRYVDAAWKDAESDSPRFGKQTRPLARFFSEALPVANLAAVHFRLFQLTSDAKDFLLYQSEGKELSVCEDGDSQAVAFKQRLLNTAGGFVGNGAGGHFEAGRLGPRGTDGVAERRWLETLELHARQTMRHTRALMDEYQPRLLVDYISTPDDMLHVWWGLMKDGDSFQEPYRRWGYQIIDWRIDQLNQLRKPEDHLLIVSDHGMTVARHEVRLNTILDTMGVGDRVVAQDQFLQLKDRSDKALLKEVQTKLSTLKDGDTQLFTNWYWPDEAAAKFGIGGDLGGDLYFDLAPGYTTTWTRAQPAIIHYDKPKGVHGPNPTRPDLFALFIASGPDLQSRPVSMRSIDVAPLVLRLLGL
jgi:hypothetical protein